MEETGYRSAVTLPFTEHNVSVPNVTVFVSLFLSLSLVPSSPASLFFGVPEV